MMRDGDRYLVYDLEKEVVGEMLFDDQREHWPEGVNGWKHALDCTVEPYLERSVEENIAFAKHVNKRNIVVPRPGDAPH